MKFFLWLKSLFTRKKDATEITQFPPQPKRAPGDDAVVAGPIKGIDVSHHNGKVDWKKVKASGIDFVFLKATEGTTYTDPTFISNAFDAKAAGLLVGAYHFLSDGRSGKDQAAWFLHRTSFADIDLPLVLDWERSNAKNEAKEFLTEIEKHTKRIPIIYGGHIIREENLDASFLKYPLWLAQYGPRADKIPKPWKKYTIWQYSETGSVAGIEGHCDLNVFDGTLDELKAL